MFLFSIVLLIPGIWMLITFLSFLLQDLENIELWRRSEQQLFFFPKNKRSTITKDFKVDMKWYPKAFFGSYGDKMVKLCYPRSRGQKSFGTFVQFQHERVCSLIITVKIHTKWHLLQQTRTRQMRRSRRRTRIVTVRTLLSDSPEEPFENYLTVIQGAPKKISA